ncbi:MAG: YoaK family protein, partial [Cellulosimicrobium funkei]
MTDPRDRPYVAGLLVLTVATGVVDAVSYLALDQVFTGNMTGNVLFVGFAAAGAGGIPLLNNVVALVAFVLGAALCGVL